MEKFPTGSAELDKFLQGGYEKGIVTTIYGTGGSGKTLLLLLAMTHAPKDKKIIFIDTEGGFSVERFGQVCPYYEKVLERTVFLSPTNFEEQKEAVDKLKDVNNAGLVIIDTLTSLYRVEMTSEDNYELNKELARQMRDLVEVARKREIPVLVTGQVYSSVDESDRINVVGGLIVKNMSKCLLELRKENDHRKLTVKKHRAMKEGKEFHFSIVEKGIKRVQDRSVSSK